MRLKELFEAKTDSTAELEAKGREALRDIDKAIDVILDVMLQTGEKSTGKKYKSFNKAGGEAWEIASDFMNEEFGKDY